MNRRTFLRAAAAGIGTLVLGEAFGSEAPRSQLTNEEIGERIWTCKISEFDVINGNRRIYPSSLIPNILKSFEEMNGSCFGTGESSDTIKTNLSEISHEVVKMTAVGKELFADIKVLSSTPRGKELCDLIRNNDEAFRMLGIGNGECRADGVYVLQTYSFIRLQNMPRSRASKFIGD